MVSDTGPGIEPDMREMVFEPFRSAETPDGKIGSGLGLAIARQLIRALGGDLTAGDAPGGGARFTIHLPPEAPGRNDEEPPPMSDGGSPGTSQMPVA
jgi:signal transduction histidine kinase